MREMARKEALTNKDITWLVKHGLWSFKQGLMHLVNVLGLSLVDVYEVITGKQLIGEAI